MVRSLSKMVSIVETHQLDVKTKHEMISLSKRICGVEEDYLESRFDIYDQVVCLRKNQRLYGFQLIQSFEQDSEVFVYFGPLVSRSGCFLELFTTYLERVMEGNQHRTINLLAEIENPEVLFLFKALFEDYAYPKFYECIVPEEIKEKVLMYSKRLWHIHKLDVEKLTTRSSSSLYNHKSKDTIVDRWLRSRNIDTTQGMNVVLYSQVPVDQEERTIFKLQLDKGRKRMGNWKEGKEEIVSLFEGGVLKNV